jgi:hypothetical protein
VTYDFADHAPPPWNHQEYWFCRTRDDEIHALFHEQRTGKSRIIIDTAAYNYERRRIDGMLVLAPAGVHANWALESIPQMMPRRIPHMIVIWRSTKMQSKTAKAMLQTLLDFDGLAILTVNYDALPTPVLKAYLAKFLRKRKLLVVADESDDLSSPAAKRTIVAGCTKSNIGIARWGKMRRILTGTPAAENPFGLYAQTNFLRFGILGFRTYHDFKQHHAEWEIDYSNFRQNKNRPHEEIRRDDNGKPIYLNLDELQSKLVDFSSRVLRSDCGAQLPRHATRLFVLSKEQRHVYDTLREKYRIELSEKQSVTAAHVLARYVRLQQVASGYVPLDREPEECVRCHATDPACPLCDGLGVVVPAPEILTLPNPRLGALEAELHGTPGQTVVWTKFQQDAQVTFDHLAQLGRRVGRFDGTVEEEERERTLAMFQRGKLDDLVANPQAGGRGRDFSMARTSIFYSHTFSLRLRLQAQDRVENLNRADQVVLVDLVGEDTVDEAIIRCHRDKRTLQDVLVAMIRRREFF